MPSRLRERLAAIEAACAECRPGNCAGCTLLDGEHCEDCTAHAVGGLSPEQAADVRKAIETSGATESPEAGAEESRDGSMAPDVDTPPRSLDVGAGVEAGDPAPGQPKRPAPPKWRCTKCHLGTTKARALEVGMCAKCQRIFDQPSYDEVLAQIPEEWEDEVHRRIQEKSTLELAAASLKKTHPIKRYGRDWCVSLVVEVDERRWRRAHGLLD